ncbi:MAG: type IV toxin-antitoxin system AbiEi family antitoxin domain-containing protein [Oscillospiraceae bacterium]|nr:type IV toxin-antitoxin system AbiEi family antitoxin domain-containing protein [Oscillospiraceae bacterium]
MPLLTPNAGMFTTAQANAAGVSNERLRLLVQSGALARPAFGVYALPDAFFDAMYAAQQRRPQIIYSHETALYLHGLTDRDPLGYSVTVPAGYNTARLRQEGFTVYTIRRELHAVGISEARTVFGHAVQAYGIERTLCDCLRSRNRMDIAILSDALKRYAKRKDKNLNTLMQMAKTFHVEKPLGGYLEVLL